MFPYCLKSKEKTESKNPKLAKTKNGRIIVLSNFTVCGNKKLKFIKEQKTKEMFGSTLGKL